MTEVALHGVTKRFGEALAVDNVDLSIPSDAFFVLVGPSGCGKSTVLRLIAGLEQPDTGEIRIGGRDVTRLPPAKREVAMVFQSYALYSHMTVYRNMAFGLKLARADGVDAKVREAAELLQLTPLLDRLPRELSGGQRQRVAIGRAIVREPKLFLFDEPLSNLDAALRVQTRVEIAALHRRLGTTSVYVTHDQAEAMTLADRMAVLDRGRVAQEGPPLELYDRPANRFVAGFIGSPAMNFLPVETAGADDGRLTIRLADGSTIPTRTPVDAAEPGQGLTLGIRPEHLAPCDPGDGPAFEVALVENLGDAHLLHLTGPAAERLVVRGSGAADHPVGTHVGVKLDPADTHLFDEAGTALPRH